MIISDKQKIADLEKEIDYYKSRESHWDEIEEDAKIIAEENAELSNSVTELTNSKIELENKVTELKKQIEKMKNVGNCKHSMNCAKWNEKQTVLGLMQFCLNCKDWELAEINDRKYKTNFFHGIQY